VGQHAQPHVVDVDIEGLVWVKSSASGSTGADCVEIAKDTGSVLVRNSRNRTGPQLTLPVAGWQALTTQL